MNSTRIRKWLDSELLHCPDRVVSRIGKDRVKGALRKEVQLNLSYCLDIDFAAKNFEYCNIENSTPEDFLYREIQTPLGELVSSIRFVGGDLSKPAVFLIYKDFPLKSAENIKIISQLLGREYASFRPQRMRWYSADDESKLIEENTFLTGDMLYVSGFIDELRSQSLPDRYEELKLRKTTSLNWYDQYIQTYQNNFIEWPEFKEMAQAESRETLDRLIKKELLYDIFIADKWAGIIGVKSTTDKFLIGYCIIEEFLLKEYRSKKFAPALQRHLIDRLPYHSDEMLFGTIHYKNIPSLRTALRIQREIMGMYLFAEM